jgi:hypothetical protein
LGRWGEKAWKINLEPAAEESEAPGKRGGGTKAPEGAKGYHMWKDLWKVVDGSRSRQKGGKWVQTKTWKERDEEFRGTGRG